MNLRTFARRIATTTRDAVRSVITPAALVVARQAQQDQEQQQPATAPDPADVYTDADMPEIVDIERAALGYDLAADSARSADRAKRKHRKLLDRLPSGLYGGWLVSRTPSNRQVADLEAIRATYARLGLGPVPMRQASPSLKVTRAEVLAEVAA